MVDPSYRELSLGRRLIRELQDISAALGLGQATFELAADRERPAINATESFGFRATATLKDRIKD